MQVLPRYKGRNLNEMKTSLSLHPFYKINLFPLQFFYFPRTLNVIQLDGLKRDKNEIQVHAVKSAGLT